MEVCIRPGDRVVVGLSGGVDSVTLLDSLQRCAGRLRLRLSAVHVNHQLSPNAPRWASFCRKLCRARGIPFQAIKVEVRRGDGVEAAARAARYGAFAGLDCDCVALAHHRDDQVETFLLQLLRGAGVKGLAAMPEVRIRDSGSIEGKALGGRQAKSPDPGSRIPVPVILRPLLDSTRGEILQYARARKLEWIEDESNADMRFARNYLRREVLPAVARRFPAYRETVARSIGHVAEAARLLDEVAAADADGSLSHGGLAVEALQRLSKARARNLLRFFIASHGVGMPGAERLEEALRQSRTARRDAQVVVALDGASLRRYAGRLYVVGGEAPAPAYARRWRGESRLALAPLGGVLTFTRSTGDGISLARLRAGVVTIRVRRGGERLQPDRRRPRRSLKNLLQEARVPPWQRSRIPLLYCGEELVWAPGLGVDHRYRAGQGEAGVRPDWSALPATRGPRAGIRECGNH